MTGYYILLIGPLVIALGALFIELYNRKKLKKSHN